MTLEKSVFVSLGCSVMVLLSGAALSQDRVELEGASIIGNRELPKVLYIAPWKKPEIGGLIDPTAGGSLIDEQLEPLDRIEFQREVRYYNWLEANP